MTTEAQKAAMRRYYEKTKRETRVYMFRFSKKADNDVIAKLDSVPNKSGYIKQLVREDSDE